MNNTKITLFKVVLSAAAALLTFTIYLYFSQPGELVVNRYGQIARDINKARAEIQGRRFWDDQLREAKRALESKYAEQLRLPELIAELVAAGEHSNKVLDAFRLQYPELRLSATAQQARELRREASGIEQAERFQRISKHLHSEVLEITEIIQVIKARTP